MIFFMRTNFGVEKIAELGQKKLSFSREFLIDVTTYRLFGISLIKSELNNNH